MSTSTPTLPPRFETVNTRRSGRTRQCVVTREVLPEAVLVRFALSPEDVVTPDIHAKLPGRGVWIGCHRTRLETAVHTQAFQRGFKARVTVPDDIVPLTAELLERRLLGLLSMSLKSGDAIIGFDQVKHAASQDPLGVRIEAADGSAGGRSKIRVIAKAVSRELDIPLPIVIGCFDSETLGRALGRDSLIHMAIRPGNLAKHLKLAAQRLAGFTPLIPTAWEDREHEDNSALQPCSPT